MQTTQNKMRNEKPSKLSNLGQDVSGAVRHNFDTYDNPEKKAEKERAKKTKDNRAAIKERAIKALETCESTDSAREILKQYELDNAKEMGKFPGCDASDMSELKAFVLSARHTRPSVEYNQMATSYNRLANVHRKIRWDVRSVEDAQKYLAPKTKNQFKEFNGIERKWELNHGPFDRPNFEQISAFLADTTRAVQFGNSLTLPEREYCLLNLKSSFEMLNEKYTFDFKALAFSFGARGKPGSIAHYEDHRKVLAFNRGWSGAFIHELGHAIDYALNLPSSDFPWELRSQYRAKLNKANLGPYMGYYMGEKEIFARLFEVYMREEFPGMTEFMQFTFSEAVMPDLCERSREWIKAKLAPLRKAELGQYEQAF